MKYKIVLGKHKETNNFKIISLYSNRRSPARVGHNVALQKLQLSNLEPSAGNKIITNQNNESQSTAITPKKHSLVF